MIIHKSFCQFHSAPVGAVHLTAKSFIVGDGKHTHMELTSSPDGNVDSIQIRISTTPGAYPSELWASITTGENGTGGVVWSQGPDKFVNSGALEDITAVVPAGQQLYFNVYDTASDGWSGATYKVSTSEGEVLSDNDGLSPGENGELAGWFAFETPPPPTPQ